MITEGSVDRPVQLDPWQLITKVGWPQGGPIVLVDIEGEFISPNPGNFTIRFDGIPRDRDSITINGTTVSFGPSGQVSLGADAAATVANLVAYLHAHPTGVTASASGNNLSLDWTTPKLTLGKSSSEITLIAASFEEDPPLAEGTTITKAMYDGLSMYDPFGNADVFRTADDLLYLIYTQIVDPDSPTGFSFRVSNQYVHRFHRAVLINMALAAPIIELDVISPSQNNYVYIDPKAYPERLMEPIDNDFVISAYPIGTEFKVGAGATITTIATPMWTFSKTITVEDVRPAPGDSIASVNSYNTIGNSPPFPYGKVRFDKNGEVA